MGNACTRVFRVLIADGSPGDRRLLRRAIGLVDGLQIVAELSSATEAISYLRGESRFSDRQQFPLPNLILLDFKQPGKYGLQTLKRLLESAPYKITVVVLTDFRETACIKKALDLGADLYEVKPHRDEERLAMMLALEDHLLQSSLSVHRHFTVSSAA
ncbi:response regulator [Pedosphaera parvula]|uniref:Response regulator receiver protein n=1 Tax=Pedosphaera parvula (strain Ellin514) TaxID=320771 RepID=B9XS63_PEDPL|nr:response regulator [Pedosphaera parvula]EEF57318.1 response regulator receiver protein [Pedosphaera parvula Ellin514]